MEVPIDTIVWGNSSFLKTDPPSSLFWKYSWALNTTSIGERLKKKRKCFCLLILLLWFNLGDKAFLHSEWKPFPLFFAHAQKRFEFPWTDLLVFQPCFYDKCWNHSLSFAADLLLWFHFFFLMQFICNTASTPQIHIQYRTISSDMCQCHIYELEFSSNSAINCLSKKSRNYLEI